VIQLLVEIAGLKIRKKRLHHFIILLKFIKEASEVMTDSEFAATEQLTARELAEVIQEFEQYRERLVNETLATAKRAKLMKSAVMSRLEPELAKIDATIKALQEQQIALGGDRP
jgi:hypothetical protein